MTGPATAEVQTLPDFVDEARRVVAEADTRGEVLRVTGSVAFQLHTRDHVRLPRPPLNDIDLVAPTKTERRLVPLLTEIGYVGEKEFNARHGDSRLIFWDPSRDRKLEVFLGTLVMCHKLPIAERLEVEAETVPLAELLLTKLQIVELNEKDIGDMHSLLIAYEVGSSDDHQINAERIAGLCARDWGLYHTVELTLDRLGSDPPSYSLTADQRRLVDHRVVTLRNALEEVPKSTGWRMRAKVGERMRWYELPEEV
jgi:hypothetical protein